MMETMTNETPAPQVPECPTCKGSGEIHVTTFSAYTGDESDPMDCDACEGSGNRRRGPDVDGDRKQLERLMVTCPSTVKDFTRWLTLTERAYAVDGWRLVDVRGRERPDGTWLACCDLEREMTAESVAS